MFRYAIQTFMFLPYTVGRPERDDSRLTGPLSLLYTGTYGLDFFLKKGQFKPLSTPRRLILFFNVSLLILP